MYCEQLFIFERIRDELISHILDEGVTIYKATQKIVVHCEEIQFYAIKRVFHSQKEIDPIDYLFEDDTNFVEFIRHQSDNIQKVPDQVILMYLNSMDYKSLPHDVRLWQPLDHCIEGVIIEIDVQKSKIGNYPSYFAERHGIGICETFEQITVGELLDCEI